MAYTVTGTLTPDATGLYEEWGSFYGYPVYRCTIGSAHWFLWREAIEFQERWFLTPDQYGVQATLGWAHNWPGTETPAGTYYGWYGASGQATATYTHVTRGRLEGSGANVAGSQGVEVSATGTLPGSGADVAGVGAVEVSASGAAVGPGAAGKGRDFDVNTGRLVGGGAQAAGLVSGPIAATGILVGGGAEVAAAGAVAIASTGALVGAGAELAAVGEVSTYYFVDARGVYRVFNAPEYWFHWSEVGPPAESDTADETNATLPYTSTETWAGTTTIYFSVQWFNGCLASGFLPVGPNGETYLRLDVDAGAEIDSPPKGPIDWQLEVRAGGVVRVHAIVYVTDDDADPDTWAIAYTTNGSTPSEDDPDVTQALRFGLGMEVLTYDLPAQADGTTVKVRLQLKRSSDSAYSEDSTVKQAVAEVVGPDEVLDVRSWAGAIPEDA